MRVVWSMVLLLVAKLATLAVPFTFKWAIDALTGADTAPVQASNWTLWLIASPLIMTVELRRPARADGGADPVARRHLRAGGDACGAQARLSHLRPHARTVAALSPRAQDRRADAGAGARPARHRSHRADGDPAAGADHRRGLAADGRAAVAVRLALRAGHPDHRRDLHVLHLHRDRMADRDPPQDERVRHRGQHQGDRLAVELRDGEIFQRRAARGHALRPFDGALRAQQRQDLYLAGGSQHRAGDHLHRRPDRDHADVRDRRAQRHQHRRRFRHGQRHDDPALPAAEFHGHGLSRDQAGDHRHREDVQRAVAQPGDQGCSRRAGR